MVTEKSTQELRIRRIKEQTSSIDKAVGRRQIRYLVVLNNNLWKGR